MLKCICKVQLSLLHVVVPGFPLHLTLETSKRVQVPLWMFPIAITCGNTFVLKPSEKVPGATMMLADLVHEAGLPPGVCFTRRSYACGSLSF